MHAKQHFKRIAAAAAALCVLASISTGMLVSADEIIRGPDEYIADTQTTGDEDANPEGDTLEPTKVPISTDRFTTNQIWVNATKQVKVKNPENPEDISFRDVNIDLSVGSFVWEINTYDDGSTCIVLSVDMKPDILTKNVTADKNAYPGCDDAYVYEFISSEHFLPNTANNDHNDNLIPAGKIMFNGAELNNNVDIVFDNSLAEDLSIKMNEINMQGVGTSGYSISVQHNKNNIIGEMEWLFRNYAAHVRNHQEYPDDYAAVPETIAIAEITLSPKNETYDKQMYVIEDIKNDSTFMGVIEPTTDKSNINERIATLKKELAKVEEDYKKLKEDYYEVNTLYGQLSTEHEQLKESHGTLYENYETTKAAYDELLTDHEDLQKEYDELKDAYDKMNGTDAAAKVDELEAELAKKEKYIKELEGRIAALEEKINNGDGSNGSGASGTLSPNGGDNGNNGSGNGSSNGSNNGSTSGTASGTADTTNNGYQNVPSSQGGSGSVSTENLSPGGSIASTGAVASGDNTAPQTGSGDIATPMALLTLAAATGMLCSRRLICKDSDVDHITTSAEK